MPCQTSRYILQRLVTRTELVATVAASHERELLRRCDHGHGIGRRISDDGRPGPARVSRERVGYQVFTKLPDGLADATCFLASAERKENVHGTASTSSRYWRAARCCREAS